MLRRGQYFRQSCRRQKEIDSNSDYHFKIRSEISTASEAAEQRPSSEAAEQRPSSEAAEQRPSSEAAEQRPSSEAAEQRPSSEAAEQRPSSEAAEQRPSSEAAEQRPSSEAAEQRPSSEAAEQRPSSEAAIEQRPSSEAAEQRPSSEAAEQRPSSEAAEQRPSSEAAEQRPSSEAAEQRPSSEAAEQRPSSEAAEQRPKFFSSITSAEPNKHQDFENSFSGDATLQTYKNSQSPKALSLQPPYIGKASAESRDNPSSDRVEKLRADSSQPQQRVNEELSNGRMIVKAKESSSPLKVTENDDSQVEAQKHKKDDPASEQDIGLRGQSTSDFQTEALASESQWHSIFYETFLEPQKLFSKPTAEFKAIFNQVHKKVVLSREGVEEQLMQESARIAHPIEALTVYCFYNIQQGIDRQISAKIGESDALVKKVDLKNSLFPNAHLWLIKVECPISSPPLTIITSTKECFFGWGWEHKFPILANETHQFIFYVKHSNEDKKVYPLKKIYSPILYFDYIIKTRRLRALSSFFDQLSKCTMSDFKTKSKKILKQMLTCFSTILDESDDISIYYSFAILGVYGFSRIASDDEKLLLSKMLDKIGPVCNTLFRLNEGVKILAMKGFAISIDLVSYVPREFVISLGLAIEQPYRSELFSMAKKVRINLDELIFLHYFGAFSINTEDDWTILWKNVKSLEVAFQLLEIYTYSVTKSDKTVPNFNKFIQTYDNIQLLQALIPAFLSKSTIFLKHLKNCPSLKSAISTVNRKPGYSDINHLRIYKDLFSSNIATHFGISKEAHEWYGEILKDDRVSLKCVLEIGLPININYGAFAASVIENSLGFPNFIEYIICINKYLAQCTDLREIEDCSKAFTDHLTIFQFKPQEILQLVNAVENLSCLKFRAGLIEHFSKMMNEEHMKFIFKEKERSSKREIIYAFIAAKLEMQFVTLAEVEQILDKDTSQIICVPFEEGTISIQIIEHKWYQEAESKDFELMDYGNVKLWQIMISKSKAIMKRFQLKRVYKKQSHYGNSLYESHISETSSYCNLLAYSEFPVQFIHSPSFKISDELPASFTLDAIATFAVHISKNIETFQKNLQMLIDQFPPLVNPTSPSQTQKSCVTLALNLLLQDSETFHEQTKLNMLVLIGLLCDVNELRVRNGFFRDITISFTGFKCEYLLKNSLKGLAKVIIRSLREQSNEWQTMLDSFREPQHAGEVFVEIFSHERNLTKDVISQLKRYASKLRRQDLNKIVTNIYYLARTFSMMLEVISCEIAASIDLSPASIERLGNTLRQYRLCIDDIETIVRLTNEHPEEMKKLLSKLALAPYLEFFLNDADNQIEANMIYFSRLCFHFKSSILCDFDWRIFKYRLIDQKIRISLVLKLFPNEGEVHDVEMMGKWLKMLSPDDYFQKNITLIDSELHELEGHNSHYALCQEAIKCLFYPFTIQECFSKAFMFDSLVSTLFREEFICWSYRKIEEFQRSDPNKILCFCCKTKYTQSPILKKIVTFSLLNLKPPSSEEIRSKLFSEPHKQDDWIIALNICTITNHCSFIHALLKTFTEVRNEIVTRMISVERLQLVINFSHEKRRQFLLYLEFELNKLEKECFEKELQNAVSELQNIETDLQSLNDFCSSFEVEAEGVTQFSKEYPKFLLKNCILPEPTPSFMSTVKKFLPVLHSHFFRSAVLRKSPFTCFDICEKCERAYNEITSRTESIIQNIKSEPMETIAKIFNIPGNVEDEISMLETTQFGFHSEFNQLRTSLLFQIDSKLMKTECESLITMEDTIAFSDKRTLSAIEKFLQHWPHLERMSVIEYARVHEEVAAVIYAGGKERARSYLAILCKVKESREVIEFLATKCTQDVIDQLKEGVTYYSESSIDLGGVTSLETLLLFYTDLKSGASSVVDLFKKIEFLISEERFRDIEKVMGRCQDILSSVKDVLVLMNNMEKIKQQQIVAIYEDSSFIFFQTSDKFFDLELQCEVSSIKHKLNSINLSGLKDRALLMKFTSNDESKMDEIHNYEVFCEFSDIILEITAIFGKLYNGGYPVKALYKGQPFSCVKGQFEDVRRFKCQVDEALIKWENYLRCAYGRNHLLTFFYGQQFWILKRHFLKESSQNSESLLEYIGFCGNSYKVEINRALGRPDKGSVEAKLNYIEKILEFLEKRSQIVQFTEKSIQRFPLGDIPKEPVAVLLTICSSTLHALVSGYLVTKRSFPQFYQILFCSAKTTRFEILAFVYRFFTDSENHLYSVVSCENLSTENQVLFIKSFDKLIHNAHCKFQLALISGTTRGYLVEYFQRTKKVKVIRVKDGQRIHTDKDLAQIVQAIDESTVVYSSKMAGMGKSKRIEAEAEGRTILKFSIAGDLNIDDICNQLKEMKSGMLLHINLGYVENSKKLNQFLMNLSLFRIVKSDDLIVCLPRESKICIELPNLQPSLTESLPYLKLLQQKTVEFDYNLHIPSDITNLLAKYNELFSCCRNSFHKHSAISSQADLLKCLFDKTIEKKVASFTRFNNFLNVLVALLTHFQKSPFSGEAIDEMIQDLERGGAASSISGATLVAEYKDIRRTIIDSFLETTKEVIAKYSEGISQMQNSALSDSSLQEGVPEYRTQSWESSSRFVMLFLEDGSMLPIYKKPKCIGEDGISKNIKKLIFLQTKSDTMTGREMAMKIQEDFDIDYYEDYSSEQLCEKLFIYCSISNGKSKPENCLNIEDKEYVLTPDNFLKMNLIYLRAIAGLPIVVMGETGCGKTSLIRFFVNNVLHESYYIINIHAGFDSRKLADEMKTIKKKAKLGRIWAFFDEFNTSACIGQICEVMCERTFQGKSLSKNIVFLGACNPYRKKIVEDDKEVGIKKAQKYINELAGKLVHVVKPLPETMIEHMWDFGALTQEDTRRYMKAMLDQLDLKSHYELLLNMIFACHMHWKNLDQSTVSIRDVKRFTLLYKWFYESLEKRRQAITKEYQQNVIRLKLHFDEVAAGDLELNAGILALCFCYYLRISRQEERGPFLEEITAACMHASGKEQITSELIRKILKFNEDDLLARMKLPKGTALNTAFRENICTMIPCVYTGIAVFICGKPGCSKSFAVQALFDNCKGRKSADPYFKSLKELIRVNYQGSEYCTSIGVENVFEKANAVLKTDKESHLPVLVFDEIGLAEISPHNPLKVLHSKLELESRDIAFIGISNWRLDASKMNRALYLARPEPREEELQSTALSLFEETNNVQRNQHCVIIAALAKAYSEFKNTLKDTDYNEFYGLRDFYNLIKLIGRLFKEKPSVTNIENAILCKTAIMRNFGGLLKATQGLIDYSEVFYQILKEKYPNFKAFKDPMSYYSMVTHSFKMQIATTLDLVQENIYDEQSRYLMIISKDDVALFVLERVLHNLPSEKKVVLVGSRMIDDDSEEYGFSSLSNVLLHMESEITLILKNMNHIYTALYDLFNQNFSRSESKNYCRVAIGAQFNPRCYVHDKFRIVILMDDDVKTLTQTDAPFLNRFEKQRFNLDLLVPQDDPLLANLREWMRRLFTPNDYRFKPMITESQVFPLYTQDFLRLLVLFSDDQLPIEERICMCKERLIEIATADLLILCKLSIFEEWEQEEIIEKWYKLHEFTFEGLVSQFSLQFENIKKIGKLVVFTFDNSTQSSVKHVHRFFSFFRSEREFLLDLKEFLENDNQLYILEINLDSGDSTHLAFIKFTVDNITKKAKFNKTFCLLIRLRRVSSRNISLCWFDSWKQITLENLSKPFTASLRDLKALLSSSTYNLIKNRNFEKRIEAITQESYLKFEFEFSQFFPKEKSFLYMLEIAGNIREDFNLVAALKDIILHQIKTRKYEAANWRMSVLQLPKCIEGSVDLKSAICIAIENEIINAYTPILYAIEQHFAFLSFFSKFQDPLKNEIQKVWISIVKNLDFDFKLQKSCNKIRIELQLDFPFSHYDFQKLSWLYNEYCIVLQIKQREAHDDGCKDEQELPETAAAAEFQRNYSRQTVLSRTISLTNASPDLQQLYISDFIRMDLLDLKLKSSTEDFVENSLENSLDNLLEIIYDALALEEFKERPLKLWMRVLSFLKNRRLGKLIFEAFKIFHSLKLSDIEGYFIKVRMQSPRMFDNLREVLDEFANELAFILVHLEKITLQKFSASLENLLDIYVILHQELGLYNFRIVEFWTALSLMLCKFPKGQEVFQLIAVQATKTKQEMKDSLFLYKKEFSDFVFASVDEMPRDQDETSRREEARLRFICSYYTILLDKRGDVISKIAEKVNNSNIWQYSAILMNKLIIKTAISDFEALDSPDDSDDLKHLEVALWSEGLQSRFAVLLCDSLYKKFPLRSPDMKQNFREASNKFEKLEKLLKNQCRFPYCSKISVIVQLNVFLGPYCYLLWKDKLLEPDILQLAGNVDNFLCQNNSFAQSLRLFCVKKTKQLCSKPNFYVWNIFRSRSSVGWTKKLQMQRHVSELWPVKRQPLYKETVEIVLRILEGSEYGESQALFQRIESEEDQLQFTLAIVTVLLENCGMNRKIQNMEKWLNFVKEHIENKLGLPIFRLFFMLVRGMPEGSALKVTADIDYVLYPLFYFLVVVLIHRKIRHPVTSILFDASGNIDLQRLKTMHVYGVEDEPLFASLKYQLDNFDHFTSLKDKVFKCSKCEFISITEITSTKCRFCTNDMATFKVIEAKELLSRSIKKYQENEPREGYSLSGFTDNYSARPISIVTLRVLHLLLNTSLLFVHQSKLVDESEFARIVGIESVNEAAKRDLYYIRTIIGDDTDTSLWLLALLEDFQAFFEIPKTDQVTHQERALFESAFDEKVKTAIVNSAKLILSLKTRFSGTDEMERLVEEVASSDQLVVYEHHQLLRICKAPSFSQVKSLFFSMDEARRSNLGVLNTYFLREKHFKQLCCLRPLIALTNSLLKQFNHRHARSDISGIKIGDLLLRDEELKKYFEEFKNSWNSHMQQPLEFKDHLLAPKILTENDEVLWFLVDHRDQGRLMAAALLYLAGLQNSLLSLFRGFLMKQSDVAYIDSTEYFVQSIKPEMILEVALENPLEMAKSYVPVCEYGKGKQILYDFERFQRLMIKSMGRAKRLSCDSLQYIQFQFELQGDGLVSNVREIISPQVIFTHEVVKNLLRCEERNSTLLRALYTSLEVVLYYIKLKKPDDSTIESFCKSSEISKIKGIERKLIEESDYSQISLSQIIGFYELVEELYFPHFSTYVAPSYQEPLESLESDVIATIERSKILGSELPPKVAILSAIRRLIIRCLPHNLNPKDLLQTYILRKDLWDKHVDEKWVKNLAHEWRFIYLANAMPLYQMLAKYENAADLDSQNHGYEGILFDILAEEQASNPEFNISKNKGQEDYDYAM